MEIVLFVGTIDDEESEEKNDNKGNDNKGKEKEEFVEKFHLAPGEEEKTTTTTTTMTLEENLDEAEGKKRGILYIYYIVQILGEITSSCKNEIREALAAHGVVEAILDLINAPGVYENNLSSFQKGFKRDLLRLLANLSFQCKSVQDKVRNLNGLIPVLNSCNIDKKNPCKFIYTKKNYYYYYYNY